MSIICYLHPWSSEYLKDFTFMTWLKNSINGNMNMRKKWWSYSCFMTFFYYVSFLEFNCYLNINHCMFVICLNVGCIFWSIYDHFPDQRQQYILICDNLTYICHFYIFGLKAILYDAYSITKYTLKILLHIMTKNI